jgi:O-antigen ligase
MLIKFQFKRLILLFMLFYQVYGIITFKDDIDNINNPFIIQIGNHKIEIIEIITIAILIYLFINIKYQTIIDNKAKYPINNIINVYILYNILILLPISIYSKIGDFSGIIKVLLIRLKIVLLPFFYLFIIPKIQINKIYLYLNICLYFLFIAGIIKIINGDVFSTPTGQIRVLWGGSSIIFFSTLIINFYKSKIKLINIINILMSIIGIFFTNHRSAYGFLLITLIIAILINSKTKVISKKYISFSILVFCLYSILQNQTVYNNIINRIKTISIYDRTASDRFLRWELSFNKFLKSPIYGSLLKDEYYDININMLQYAPHNFIFEILSTEGVIGLIFYMFIIIYTINAALKNTKDIVIMQFLLIFIYYILFSSFNVTFLNNWTLTIMILSISIINYRSKYINK